MGAVCCYSNYVYGFCLWWTWFLTYAVFFFWLVGPCFFVFILGSRVLSAADPFTKLQRARSGRTVTAEVSKRLESKRRVSSFLEVYSTVPNVYLL